MATEKIEFIYNVRKPKRLENNIFALYSPERIKLQPGEMKTINMNLKIKLPKEIAGCCKILDTFAENGIQLLGSQCISTETNYSQEVYFQKNEKDLPPFNLTIDIFNRNLNKTLQIRKKQEIGFFVILNDRGEEISHIFKKEQ